MPGRSSGKTAAFGSRHGLDLVKVGFEFRVYREGEYVATVVVDQVEQDHCLAHSRREIEKSPIKVGDTAIKQF